jgi:hypothetical protein
MEIFPLVVEGKIIPTMVENINASYSIHSNHFILILANSIELHDIFYTDGFFSKLTLLPKKNHNTSF